MLRYNKQYQLIADRFAKGYPGWDWIGAEYIGQYHEMGWCDALGPGWLTFKPYGKERDAITGLYQYIFINEEELKLYSDIYEIRYRKVPFEGFIHSEKIETPKPVKSRPHPRQKQYIVAITTELEP